VTPTEHDELRQLGEELREAFASERRAIAELDHHALAAIFVVKQRIVPRLSELKAAASPDRELRALFEVIRTEAHATALLANHANHAVNALLGREASGYDRRANRTIATPSLRTFRAY